MHRLLPASSNADTAASFLHRHIGTNAHEQAHMLATLGYDSLDAFMDAVIPQSIRLSRPLELPEALSEVEALHALQTLASRNEVRKNFIGCGYYGTHTPSVIQRNILENPAWYTAYTPYQAEISQGRLQALLNFQTLVSDLTGLPVANASLLDEATAAAEAMTMAVRHAAARHTRRFLVHADVHPQTLEVLRTRAEPLGIDLQVLDTVTGIDAALDAPHCGLLLPYPSSTGAVPDWNEWCSRSHAQGALCIVAADLLALTLLRPPSEWGADIAIGSSQRLGMPMGTGGPHAAFMACSTTLQRNLPGRIVGVSVDVHGQPALRLALQTREQHIRREKATSNICTAQVLPAVVSSMYAVYHGPDGLQAIAERIARYTAILAQGLRALGWQLRHSSAFDTLTVHTGNDKDRILTRADAVQVNLRTDQAHALGISLDETTTPADIALLWDIFARDDVVQPSWPPSLDAIPTLLPEPLLRRSSFLTYPVFHQHRSETALLRYIRQLSDQDLALDRCMIPLGSCTMKLNATSEMVPVTWPAFAHVHPYAPAAQRQGTAQMVAELEHWLALLTGYCRVSVQPNAGSQGEYAGLLAIRAWHRQQGHTKRTVCLIPASAHGTNPASAQLCGMQVVVVACDDRGSVSLEDLQTQCAKYADTLACIMLTYPSTHGVFEQHITQLCDIVHDYGGLVYVDGANFNALAGWAAPGAFGGDVSHLNLHKTFCIPHGGGGPGVGPVCLGERLKNLHPAHTSTGLGGGVGAVSAAPWGNAGVLPIAWMYLRMMGASGLRHATASAILAANYIRHRLQAHYPTLYADEHGLVAHECILDVRQFKESSGVSAEDIAKRLIDYGFHAPTLSFPVPNTLMVEPTESEPLAEIERFIAAMVAIREEIRHIEQGHWPRDNHPLKHAPHTVHAVLQEHWTHPYPRTVAAACQTPDKTYWPPVGRIDNVHGDRNLICSCPPRVLT